MYAERITSGGCDQGGAWRVRVDDRRRVEAAWTSSTADYTVTAVLER